MILTCRHRGCFLPMQQHLFHYCSFRRWTMLETPWISDLVDPFTTNNTTSTWLKIGPAKWRLKATSDGRGSNRFTALPRQKPGLPVFVKTLSERQVQSSPSHFREQLSAQRVSPLRWISPRLWDPLASGRWHARVGKQKRKHLSSRHLLTKTFVCFKGMMEALPCRASLH